jgi:hypothetical protein
VPGTVHPDRSRSLFLPLRLVAALGILVIVAACGGSSATGTPQASATARPSSGPTSAPSDASSAAPSDTPTDEPSDEPSDAPSDEPSDSPSGDGVAVACTGNQSNQDFFASIAGAVDWPVYCAVLPERWFVDTGEYSLRRGGRLDISYRGPGGARLRLQEGAFCSQGETGCLPPGSDAGPTDFGDMDGTLVRLDDGTYAVVVGNGEPLAWVAHFAGTDEATAREIAAALTLVK